MSEEMRAVSGGQTVLIQGDTYRVKEELKALGGVWDAIAKGWRVPKQNEAEARNLVENMRGQMRFDEEEG